jgi:hypothetical protein
MSTTTDTISTFRTLTCAERVTIAKSIASGVSGQGMTINPNKERPALNLTIASSGAHYSDVATAMKKLGASYNPTLRVWNFTLTRYPPATSLAAGEDYYDKMIAEFNRAGIIVASWPSMPYIHLWSVIGSWTDWVGTHSSLSPYRYVLVLKTPFEAREVASKNLGATWDPTYKHWYISDFKKISREQIDLIDDHQWYGGFIDKTGTDGETTPSLIVPRAMVRGSNRVNGFESPETWALINPKDKTWKVHFSLHKPSALNLYFNQKVMTYTDNGLVGQTLPQWGREAWNEYIRMGFVSVKA